MSGSSSGPSDVRLSLYALAIFGMLLGSCLFLTKTNPSGLPGVPIWELWAVAVSFLVAVVLTNLLIGLAPRLGLVDLPDPRKVHTRPTPRAGGIAIYVAMVISCLMIGPSRSLFITLSLGFVIALLGLLDDRRPLPWQLRLAVQAGAAAIAVIFLPDGTSWWLRLAAVFWIVGLVNAFNMLDNMDALSGGVAWIAAAGFAGVLVLRPSGSPEAWPYLLLMAALLGFLWFNRPPARIFMGDAGSTFLGFFLGVRSIEDIVLTTAAPQSYLLPLCILAVPWYDLICVVSLRLWQGHSPFHADKQHVSHRLVRLGLPSPTAVRVIHLFGMASALAGVLLDHVAPIYAWLVVGQLVCWCLAVAVIEYFPHYRTGPDQASDGSS